MGTYSIFFRMSTHECSPERISNMSNLVCNQKYMENVKTVPIFKVNICDFLWMKWFFLGDKDIRTQL